MPVPRVRSTALVALIDYLPAVEQFFQPPASHNEMILDDWDLTMGFSAPAAALPAVPVTSSFPARPATGECVPRIGYTGCTISASHGNHARAC